MIHIEHLHKTYRGGIHALNDLSLSIQGTGMFGLLGPNGAGKTTLMRILAGLLRPSSGRVQVFGHDLATSAGKLAVKQQLGYLPQHLAFYPNLSAREFLDYIAILKGIAQPAERRRQVAELLDLVHLSKVADHRLKTYSGGMQQRVGIAQALLGEPTLLIVDEPTVGLDPEERVRVRTMLGEVARRCAVILSTHVIEDIGQSCNQLAIIAGGTVRYQGTPHDLIEQAQGKVWSVITEGAPPSIAGRIVATLQLQQGVQYRVVSADAPMGGSALAPSLEDGYLAVMAN